MAGVAQCCQVPNTIFPTAMRTLWCVYTAPQGPSIRSILLLWIPMAFDLIATILLSVGGPTAQDTAKHWEDSVAPAACACTSCRSCL